MKKNNILSQENVLIFFLSFLFFFISLFYKHAQTISFGDSLSVLTNRSLMMQHLLLQSQQNSNTNNLIPNIYQSILGDFMYVGNLSWSDYTVRDCISVPNIVDKSVQNGLLSPCIVQSK
jgi:hypothetical protein